MVPSSDWTPAEKGSQDVPMIGIDDKITAVMACTINGKLLPPQLLYQGTTSHCHPLASVSFPEGWDIWHSESHWTTQVTIKRYITNVLKPCAESAKVRLGQPESQGGIIILDVYAAHRTPDVLKEFETNGFDLVFVPANCTSELQSLDLSLNGHLKKSVRKV